VYVEFPGIIVFESYNKIIIVYVISVAPALAAKPTRSDVKTAELVSKLKNSVPFGITR